MFRSLSLLQAEKLLEEGHRTQTSKEQTAVEGAVDKCFIRLDHLLAKDHNLPILNREDHISYLVGSIGSVSASYQGLDCSRPWMVYWILNSFSLLDFKLPHQIDDDIISFLTKCRSPDGGFGGGPGQFPHLATTYAAVNSLCLIGTHEAYTAIDRQSLKKFLLSVRHPNGSYSMHVNGEVDVRGAYCAIAVAKLVNYPKDVMAELFAGTAKWIASCQTYEGGIGGTPDLEAHGGYSFCGVAALALLEDTSTLNLHALLKWTVHRQMRFEGGFQGRTNKLVDGCYSFWQAAIIPIVQALMSMETPSQYPLLKKPLFHVEALQEYVLICCQDFDGGLIDKPGKPPDTYHTCYTLSGLSIAQHAESGKSEPNVVGGPENEIIPTHPLYNIHGKAVSQSILHFAKLNDLMDYDDEDEIGSRMKAARNMESPWEQSDPIELPDSPTSVSFQNQAKKIQRYKISAETSLKDKDKVIAKLSTEELLNESLSDLDECYFLLEEKQAKFNRDTNAGIKQLYDLSLILDIVEKLDHIAYSYQVVFQNIVNLKTTLNSTEVRNYRKELIRKSLSEIQRQFEIVTDIYPQFWLKVQQIESEDDSLDNQYQSDLDLDFFLEDLVMDSDAKKLKKITSQEIQQMLDSEIKKNRKLLVVKQSELIEMKNSLFGAKASQVEQRTKAVSHIEEKEKDLKVRLKAINELELDVIALEKECERICREKQLATEKLLAKRNELDKLINDLIRLQELSESLADKGQKRASQYAAKMEELAARQEAILNDPNLTPEEKQEMLKQIQEEVRKAEEQYQADMQVIDAEREKARRDSKLAASSLSNLQNELLAKHLAEVEQLEQMKIGASPSEIDRINEKIAELNSSFQRQTEMIYRLKNQHDFFVDDFGRYYIDELGRRVYQRDSLASKFIRNEDGTFTKIANAIEVLTDEIGDYYIDDAGNKIYLRKYEVDEYGQYYIDAYGRRVYKAHADGSEYILVDGVMVKIKDARTRNAAEQTSGDFVEEESVTSIDIKRQEDLNYVKNCLGNVLRMGLASITMHQPTDPINYLANFMLQYRYNELKYLKRQKELEELLVERENVSKLRAELKRRKKKGLNDCDPCTFYEKLGMEEASECECPCEQVED